MIYHLIGLTEAEAHASIDEHGDPETCFWKGCDQPAVVAIIGKKPGSGWGQNLATTAACTGHKPELIRILKKVTR